MSESIERACVNRCCYLRASADRSYTTIGDNSYTMTWHWIQKEREERARANTHSHTNSTAPYACFFSLSRFRLSKHTKRFLIFVCTHIHMHTDTNAYTCTAAMPGPVILFAIILYGEQWFPLSSRIRSHFVGGPLCIILCALCGNLLNSLALLLHSLVCHAPSSAVQYSGRINSKNQVVCKDSESGIICSCVVAFFFSPFLSLLISVSSSPLSFRICARNQTKKKRKKQQKQNPTIERQTRVPRQSHGLAYFRL